MLLYMLYVESIDLLKSTWENKLKSNNKFKEDYIIYSVIRKKTKRRESKEF